MAEPFPGLARPAARELHHQIKGMTPNPTALHSKGWGWQAATTLVKAISSGNPDIGELRSHGIDIKSAVAVCEAIAARHAALNAAPALKPAPPAAAVSAAAKSVLVAPAVAIRAMEPKPLPAAPSEPLSAGAAATMLHSICVAIERSQAVERHKACPTQLSWDGLSPSTAAELANIINTARSF